MERAQTRGVARRYDTVTRPEVLDALRRGFRQMNRAMVLLFRLGLGRVLNSWPSVGGRILVLNHVGRSSGKAYRTPVNYAAHAHALYCVAAFGAGTDWYRNALANPTIEVWLPEGRWRCLAEDASDAPDRIELIRDVLIASGFAAPLFGLHPRQMTDEGLAAATEDYGVLRLSRHERLEGSAGDLAWTWPAALGVIAIAATIRWHRRDP